MSTRALSRCVFMGCAPRIDGENIAIRTCTCTQTNRGTNKIFIEHISLESSKKLREDSIQYVHLNVVSFVKSIQ